MKTNLERTLMVASLETYCTVVCEVANIWYHEQGYNKLPIVSYEIGRKYAKVQVNDTVHTFVDMTNGDILKAATYKAPAKNGVRGSILSPDNGRGVINWYGAKYLR